MGEIENCENLASSESDRNLFDENGVDQKFYEKAFPEYKRFKFENLCLNFLVFNDEQGKRSIFVRTHPSEAGLRRLEVYSKIWHDLESPYILKLFNIRRTFRKDRIFIALETENVTCGLDHYLRNYKFSHLSHLSITIQVTKALAYLEGLRLSHNNLDIESYFVKCSETSNDQIVLGNLENCGSISFGTDSSGLASVIVRKSSKRGQNNSP